MPTEDAPAWCARLIAEFLAADARATALAGTLVRDLANWKPRPDAWSINPFVPVIRFTIGAGFEILSRHEDRHLLQAERVRQAPDFPAA